MIFWSFQNKYLGKAPRITPRLIYYYLKKQIIFFSVENQVEWLKYLLDCIWLQFLIIN